MFSERMRRIKFRRDLGAKQIGSRVITRTTGALRRAGRYGNRAQPLAANDVLRQELPCDLIQCQYGIPLENASILWLSCLRRNLSFGLYIDFLFKTVRVLEPLIIPDCRPIDRLSIIDPIPSKID